MAETSPLIIDTSELLVRLTLQERQLLRHLSESEDRIRRFEDFELPAYGEWLRLQLGPKLVALQEIFEQIYERRILVQKINDLLESGKYSTREALYIATLKHPHPDEPKPEFNEWDKDEIKARRQAKREEKRAARRIQKGQHKRTKNTTQERAPEIEGPNPRRNNRLISLYRALARRLHPDSPASIEGLPASRVLSLWMEVQSAYKSSNLERLMAIAAWIKVGTVEGGLDSSSSEMTFSERIDRIRILTRSCSRLERKLSELTAHPAWEFENIRGNARRKLRQRAARELEEETARTQEVLDALDDYLDSIGSPKQPKKWHP